jgi:1-phosphofructokinase family hexose kinase
VRLVAVAPNPAIDRLYELDRLERDTVNRPRIETRVAGGKGVNVARAASLLGAEVRVVALLAGHAGRWLAETLAGEGIAGRFAWATGETRTCIAIHDATDDTLTELNEAGPTVTVETWAGLVEALRAELAAGGAGLVTVSGSLPPGAPTDGLVELALAAQGAGVPIALDAGGPALRAAMAIGPWLVKLNVAEAAATLDVAIPQGEVDVIAAARRIAARTNGAVVVTLGPDGAVAVAPGGATHRVGPSPVRGPFPVGGGDAFLAGIATATLAGRPLPEALRLGAAAATANAEARGAGRLDRARAERLVNDVRVSAIPG